MSRAERIAKEILSSERFAQTKAFKDRVYSDEPILRAGMSIPSKPKQDRKDKRAESEPVTSRSSTPAAAPQPAPQRTSAPAPAPAPAPASVPRPTPAPATTHSSWSLRSFNIEPSAPPKRVRNMPDRYKKMRALKSKRTSWNYSYSAGGNRLFYEQARFMEDFEDHYKGDSSFNRYYPTYDDMDDYDLRCYFSWRTRLRSWRRKKEQAPPPAPTSFVFVHVYEILCGVGVEPGVEGYEELEELRQAYAGISDAFDAYMCRWIHDYVIFHALDAALLPPSASSGFTLAVRTLRQAETALLSLLPKQKQLTWPQTSLEGLPKSEELLDALIALSRYRADRSRFFKDNRNDVALVCSRVFARMVEHCAKRRKKGLVDGFFGERSMMPYNLYYAAVFWAEHPHEEAVYDCGAGGVYHCMNGIWFLEEPYRRDDKNAELGNLLHTIDARMRERSGDKHALKARKLPKYQAKFVEEEVEALYAQREAEEAARVRIDRSALAHIRSAAAVTREALLTDDERADVEVLEPQQAYANKSEAQPAQSQATPAPAKQPSLFDAPVPEPATVPTPVSAPAPMPTPAQGASHESAAPSVLGLTPEQSELLRALVENGPVPAGNGMFLSLAVDAINECFLDIVGDTVIEFDGETPVLVEDYVEEVREALA